MADTTLPDLGLVGLARSGKDTLAGLLVEHGPYVRVAFADALKAAALEVDPIVTTPAPAWRQGRLSEVVAALGWEEAKAYPEVRRLLQAYGVTVRNLDADFWVRAALRDVDRAPRDFPIVITDVRFPNELEAVRSRSGLVVKVTRPGAGLDGPAGAHASERLAHEATSDLTVRNDGSLDDLRQTALDLLSCLEGIARQRKDPRNA